MASLLEELKRRNVIRVAVGYLVLAWVVLQITDLVAPALRLPEWTLSFVTFVGIIGFPFALFFAWIFELTPEGLKRSEDVEPEESITSTTAGNLNKVIIGLLCVAVVTLLADRFFGLSQMLAPADEPVIAEAPQEAIDADADGDDKPRSIAVLPFVNMSDDKEQEYFSDGISEELLNALAQIQELRVAARTSSFAFKGKNQDIKNIGEQLDVETVLEGSVRKSGARVRITAQLINVDDGYHLWSNTYDRDLTDIFAVQDEISAAIVEALKVHLTDSSPSMADSQVDVAAYNLYLQARHNVRLRTFESLQLALKQYQQALDIDPTYAAAWAGKGLATELLGEDQYGDIPAEQSTREAQKYLDVAFSIDPDLAEAHAAQALIYLDEYECPGAIASIERALAKAPHEGVLYLWKSHCHRARGEYPEWMAALEKAYRVDPLHAAIGVNWVDYQVQRGNYDELRASVTEGTSQYYRAEWSIAEAEGRWADMYSLLSEALDNDGGMSRFNFDMGVTLFMYLVEYERALDLLPEFFGQIIQSIQNPSVIIEELRGVAPESLSPSNRHLLILAMINDGQCEQVERLVAPLELDNRSHFGDVLAWNDTFNIATSYVWCLHELGDTDAAIQLATRLVDYTERIGGWGRMQQGYGNELSLLQVVLGDEEGAVATLQEMFDANLLRPSSLNGYFPHHVELAKREDFQNLILSVQDKLNAEREELGWSAVTLGPRRVASHAAGNAQ